MNFCLNYFFESEEILRTLLKTVSGALKDGGVFVGIALDGDKVKNGCLSTETYNITPGIDFHDDTKIYNKSYIFSFNEKQNDYFDYRGSQTEYLISLQELDRVALEFNLERVHHNSIQYSEIDVLNFDVIFKYSLKKNDNNYILSPVKFFPSSVDCSLLKIMPHTHSVCSRPDASRFLVNLILKHFSKQINIIVDSTAHVGSDTIAFALRFNKATIFAIEQDYETAQMLEHNIKTCAFNTVTVINLNCLDFLSQKIAKNIDVLYIDAPWGDNYKKQTSLSLYLNNIELSCVIKEYCSKCELIVLKVPINFDLELFTSKMPEYTINIYSYIVHSMNKFNFP
jgi:predicted RNA methylase